MVKISERYPGNTFLWSLRSKLIRWLAGSNAVMCNVHLQDGTIVIEAGQTALITDCFIEATGKAPTIKGDCCGLDA